jgi:hypothetical protein
VPAAPGALSRQLSSSSASVSRLSRCGSSAAASRRLTRGGSLGAISPGNTGDKFAERGSGCSRPKDEVMKPCVAERRCMLGAAEQSAELENSQGVAGPCIVRVVAPDERGAVRAQPCCALMVFWLQIPREVALTRLSGSTEFGHLSLLPGIKKPPGGCRAISLMLEFPKLIPAFAVHVNCDIRNRSRSGPLNHVRRV